MTTLVGSALVTGECLAVHMSDYNPFREINSNFGVTKALCSFSSTTGHFRAFGTVALQFLIKPQGSTMLPRVMNS